QHNHWCSYQMVALHWSLAGRSVQLLQRYRWTCAAQVSSMQSRSSTNISRQVALVVFGRATTFTANIQARWTANFREPGAALDEDLRFPCSLGASHLQHCIRDSPTPPFDLQHLKALVEEARHRPVQRAGRSPSRKPNAAGEWPCTRCGRFLCSGDFYPDRSRKTNLVSISARCKDCTKGDVRSYKRTLRGNLVKLLGGAKDKSKKQNWPTCTLTTRDILDMVWAQEARCAYSGVTMEIRIPNSHWRMSLERKNNEIGYSPTNCVLIADEFNTGDYSRCPGIDRREVSGTAQWSADKVQSVLQVRRFNVDLVSLASDISEAALSPRMQVRQPRLVYRRTPTDEGEWVCGKCGVFKSSDAFHKSVVKRSAIQSHCKDCTREQHRLRCKMLRGNALMLLSSARRRSLQRQQTFALTLDELLDMLWLQAGRCSYSGVPLQYKQRHTHWRMSLERVDNSIGYTKDNCVLIAVEFNSSDRSRNVATTDVFGTAQWSRSKAAHVWGRYFPT
ncbi:unnamed protein product, partial [Polarella glacialis]